LTDNGTRLPVLDITHPLFISSIDETTLDVLSKMAIKQAKSLTENPLLRFFTKRSLTLGSFLPKEKSMLCRKSIHGKILIINQLVASSYSYVREIDHDTL
jgi:hypothetical protein